MKKYLLALVAAIAGSVITGCTAIYEKFGTSPDELHDIAVQKVTDYAENAINKKIEASDKLTEEGKVKLKAEVARLKNEIIAKIAEIKAKIDASEDDNPVKKDDSAK